MAENEGPKFTLAELADIDITQVDEIRFELMPRMSGEWEVKDCRLDTIGQEEKTAIVIEAQPISVAQVVDEDYKDPASWAKLLEKTHRENFFIKDAKDLGRFKAFCIDAGVGIPGKESGEKISTGQLMEAIKGMKFPGRIDQSASKDGTKKFANLRPIVAKK